MLRSIDRVSEAYYNHLGEESGEEVRRRVHWICEKSMGENILDVGCSQGITSILLGREGKNVLGIDLMKESIDYATEILNREPESTRKFVEFEVANFIDFPFEDRKYDSIIFGEVLEYVTDTTRFMNKAKELVTDNGQVIVTVRFGKSNDLNQSKVFYLYNLLDLQTSGLRIKEIEFFGEWVGVIYTKDENMNTKKIDNDLLKKLEENFYSIEGTNSKLNALTPEKVEITVQKEIEKPQEEVAATKEIVATKETSNEKDIQSKADDNRIKELNQQIKKYKEEINQLKKTQQQYKNKLADSERVIKIAKKETINANKLLLDSYKKEKRLLKNHSNLLKKYEALKSSKLGNLTINYWKWRRRNFGGKTSGSKIN